MQAIRDGVKVKKGKETSVLKSQMALAKLSTSFPGQLHFYSWEVGARCPAYRGL
jgi:hypothetical protein